MYEYHKLVRMIVRAYHSPEDIIVLDALCHLIELHDTPTNHTVTDKQVAQLLALPEKRVQSVLTGLKQKQLVKLFAKEEEKSSEQPLLEHISKRQKFTPMRGGQHNKAGLIWYIDYTHVLKVLQWRRYSVYQQLNQHVDQSAVYYTCPTPGCANYGRHFALMELLLEDGMKGGNGGGFVCDGCEVEIGGKKQGTPLVVVGSGAATAGSADNGSDGQESVKALFNVQIQPISAQMKLVEQLLDEQAAHAEDVMEEAHAPRQLAATDDGTADITVDIAASASGSGAAGGTAGQQSAAVASGGSRVLHVPTVRADQAKGVVAALPWAEGGAKGLEEERKREEETRRKEREDEEERQRQAEEARYQQQYDEELQRMKALHAAETTAAAAVDESMVAEDDAETGVEEAGDEVMVSVGGRPVPLTAITQADLEEMTPEESELYDSMYAGAGF